MWEDLTPRQATALGVLALVPVLAYLIGRTDILGVVSAISVVVIIVALLIMFTPINGSRNARTDGTA